MKSKRQKIDNGNYVMTNDKNISKTINFSNF